MTTLTLTQPSAFASALERQARRRDTGLPTVTALSGPVGLCVRAWRRWAEGRGTPVVLVGQFETEAVVRAWVEKLARGRDLFADAIAYLAARLGRLIVEVRSSLASWTLQDYEHFCKALPLDPASDPALDACLWLLRGFVAGGPLPDDLAGALNELLAGPRAGWHAVVIALVELIPPGRLPAVMLPLAAPVTGDVASVERAGRVLAELAERCPALPIALAAEADVLRDYLAGPAETRARALVREGLITIAGLSESALIERVRLRTATAEAIAGSLRRLAADGSSEELADAFAEAARLAHAGDTDDARSAAERFLFERLETLPDTVGRFILNGQPGFAFGNKLAEVDLLAPDWRLAVELDGWYHHTRDRNNYRRDRRKDWELQKRGYLVLRFLSDDVVSRLGEILDTVLAAVHERRQPTSE
jgi:hypothetical protein